MATKTKDWRINEYGINVNDLKAGSWVVVHWEDTERQVALLLEVENRAASYKGNRNVKLFDHFHDEWLQTVPTAQHDQVVAVLGSIEQMTYEQALRKAKVYSK